VTSLGPRIKKHLQNSNYKGRKPYTKPSKTPQNLPRTEQQQLGNSLEANPTRALHQSDRSEAPVRPVKAGQHVMNNILQVNSPKSNFRSPDLLHGFAQDFGHSRNTSWALHSQDLVHQNFLNQEESKKSHQERL
jgi:hypothetical protein